MDNMHLSEMYGNVIKVVNARGMKLGEFMTRPGTFFDYMFYPLTNLLVLSNYIISLGG